MDGERISLANFLNSLTFVRTKKDLAAVQTKDRKMLIGGFLLVFLLFLSIMTKTLPNAIHALHVHDGLGLLVDILSSLPTFLLLFTFPLVSKFMRKSSSFPAKVLELRWRLNNGEVVPPASAQPLPFETSELPFAPARIGPVGRLKNLGSSVIGTVIGIGIFLLFVDVILGFLVLGFLQFIQMDDSATSNFWPAFALGVVFLLFVCFTALVFIFAVRILRAKMVVVDERGLHWQWPGLIKRGSIAMAWPEITGFYEITTRENEGIKIYLLDSARSTFVWDLRESSTQKEQQASAYLVRLAATYTGLSLRDLTSAVEPLLSPAQATKEVEEV